LAGIASAVEQAQSVREWALADRERIDASRARRSSLTDSCHADQGGSHERCYEPADEH
jgi:hypothetical protein